jgi:hypothetical protein
MDVIVELLALQPLIVSTNGVGVVEPVQRAAQMQLMKGCIHSQKSTKSCAGPATY